MLTNAARDDEQKVVSPVKGDEIQIQKGSNLQTMYFNGTKWIPVGTKPLKVDFTNRSFAIAR